MHPHRCSHDGERKTGEAVDKRGGKCADGKQREVERLKLVHGHAPCWPAGDCAAGDGATLGRPKWLRGGCLDLRSLSDSASGEVISPCARPRGRQIWRHLGLPFCGAAIARHAARHRHKTIAITVSSRSCQGSAFMPSPRFTTKNSPTKSASSS